ncbi:MAG: peptide ABC transporter permease [Planctomycetes bacterium]|nr:peptide ABC transporter permease [Planctomycetota bacterium]MDP6423361.1 ABC transporter permease [Planctomycetota bacterium]
MIPFLLRRVLYSIPVILGVALIVLFLFDVAGGDPIQIKLGKNPDPIDVAELRVEMGQDKPFFGKYVDFLGQIATVDFGTSWFTETPIRTIFARGIVPTLSLTMPAFLLGAGIAVALALLVAFYRGSMLDKAMTLLAIAAISISSLVYILVLQWLLADRWKLFPIWGYERGLGSLTFIVLPILIWVLLSVGTDMRYFRTVALEEIGRDYVRTARSKGVAEGKILFTHVLRNCAIPIVTRCAIIVPFLITGSFLLEIFFGIPGLGTVLYESIKSSDLPVIKAFTMLGTVLYIVFNVVADILYAALDPRIRLS